MTQVSAPKHPGRRIEQKRGQKTYNRLIETGFKLLQHRELESCDVGGIRSIRDPEFFEPLRQRGYDFADALIERINRRVRRALAKEEDAKLKIFCSAITTTLMINHANSMETIV